MPGVSVRCQRSLVSRVEGIAKRQSKGKSQTTDLLRMIQTESFSRIRNDKKAI